MIRWLERIYRLILGGSSIPAEASRSGALAASTSETVLDTTDPVIIDTLQLGSNDASNIVITVQRYDSDKATLRNMKYAGTNGNAVGQEFTASIANSCADKRIYPFLQTAYDAGSNYYGICNFAPIDCPFGVKVVVKNNDAGGAHNAAVTVGYRKKAV